MAKDLTDSMITKKYFGQKKKHWVEDQFFEVRFKQIESSLSPERREKWNKMPMQRKKLFVTKLIHKGVMI